MKTTTWINDLEFYDIHQMESAIEKKFALELAAYDPEDDNEVPEKKWIGFSIECPVKEYKSQIDFTLDKKEAVAFAKSILLIAESL